MKKKEVVELFVKANMPTETNALIDLIKDLEEKGLLDKENEEAPISSNSNENLPIFSYGDGQTARVRKEIVSGDLKITVGTIVTKRGGVYYWPKSPTENYDIPANQVEGNGEFFEFPDGSGTYMTIDNIIKMIPTPSLN